MTSLAVQDDELDQVPQDCDLDFWAIQVVVREGRYMSLTRPELIIAIKLMREKGYMPTDIADVVRRGTQVVTKILHRDEWPVPREVVVERVQVGATLPSSGPFMSRREARNVHHRGRTAR